MIIDETEKVEKTSPNLSDERIEQLKSVFPEVFSEGKIDFDKLRTALGDTIDDGPDRYSFTWAGKRDATQLLQTPSYATLIPTEDESTNFATTQNLFLEGDNLEILKLLYKSYSGRVKMIYIDPPYNTGNDFVYPDNFAHPLDGYLEFTGQKDAAGNLLTSNPETSGRYHSAWLSMMYPRLFLARQLLRDDGAIFVSIDDHEAYNLRMLMNEIFGEENFVDCLVWQKKVSPSNDAKWFSSDHDYILVYARSKEAWRPYRLERNERQAGYYTNPDNDPRGNWNSVAYTCNKSKQERPNLYYPIINPNTGEKIWPRETAVWKYSEEQHRRHIQENLIYWGTDGKSKSPRLKKFLSEAGDVVPRSILPYAEVGHTQEATTEFLRLFPYGGFSSPKPSRLLKQLVQLGAHSQKADIILDFFSGSCTTAQAVLELNREDSGNRRFIMVQLPEPTDNPQFPTIADIGKERIRRVIAKMKSEDEGKLGLSTCEKPEDLGFKVFKLAPSNYKQWKNVDSTDAEAYMKQLTFFTDPLVEGWKPANVIWEVVIKEGYGLSVIVKPLKELRENTVWQVTDPDKVQSFLICLDDTLHLSTLSALPLTKEGVFVCLNQALDDTLAANLALQCRLKKI